MPKNSANKDGEIIIPHGSSPLKIEESQPTPDIKNDVPVSPATVQAAGPNLQPDVITKTAKEQHSDSEPYDMFAELDKGETSKANRTMSENKPDLSIKRSTSEWWRPGYHAPSNIGVKATAATIRPPANNRKKILLATSITVGAILLLSIFIVILNSRS